MNVNGHKKNDFKWMKNRVVHVTNWAVPHHNFRKEIDMWRVSVNGRSIYIIFVSFWSTFHTRFDWTSTVIRNRKLTTFDEVRISRDWKRVQILVPLILPSSALYSLAWKFDCCCGHQSTIKLAMNRLIQLFVLPPFSVPFLAPNKSLQLAIHVCKPISNCQNTIQT